MKSMTISTFEASVFVQKTVSRPENGMILEVDGSFKSKNCSPTPKENRLISKDGKNSFKKKFRMQPKR